MTLFHAHSTRLLPTLTYNSCPVPRLQRIPSQLPVISKRVHDYGVFRCCVNGGLDAESGDNAKSPVLKTSEAASALANSDALKGEKLAAQTAGEETSWIARSEGRIERVWLWLGCFNLDSNLTVACAVALYPKFTLHQGFKQSWHLELGFLSCTGCSTWTCWFICGRWVYVWFFFRACEGA